MKQNENIKKRNFEDALFLALRDHGLLYPSEQNEIGATMENGEATLPKGLDDPEKYLPKRGKVVVFAPKRELKYLKVASKTNRMKKRKK